MLTDSFIHRHASRLVFALAVVLLIGAGVYGQLSQGLSGNEQFLPEIMPEAVDFNSVRTSGGATLYLAKNQAGDELGYVSASEGPGYLRHYLALQRLLYRYE